MPTHEEVGVICSDVEGNEDAICREIRVSKSSRRMLGRIGVSGCQLGALGDFGVGVEQ